MRLATVDNYTDTNRSVQSDDRRPKARDQDPLQGRNAAVNTVSTEDVLNKAYRLAYFIHQDKGVATRIVADATLKLNVAMASQSKRLYYVPVGRFSPGESRRTDGIRNKALFSDLHLLQRLVYIESEPYERQKERAAQVATSGVHAVGRPASDEDLLVYFIKHLVRITTKRNAFYVTLGISRLLHSYSTLETMEIYNAVIGEPERVKDDYYYRSRKAVLMHEMCQRFGQLIRACRQRRGEERFETQPGTNEQRSLVRECLRLFTPWDTQCPVPRDFDPFKSVIAALTSRSNADENRIEISRIHAILHSDCFERLVAAFGYSPPGERMELPRFYTQETDDQSPPGPRSTPTELNAEEMAAINDLLAEQARRRRRSSPTGVIRVMVDGVERARLNPAEESSISFSADQDAEMIEVKTTDSSGDLLLATHLLTSFGDAAIVSSIRLEGGQDLSLRITRDASGNDLLVKFGYQESAPFRVLGLWWQWIKRRFSAEEDPNSRSLWGGSSVTAGYVLVATVVIILLTSFVGYVVLRSRPGSGPEQVSQVQTLPVEPSVPRDSGPSKSNKVDEPTPRPVPKEKPPSRTKAPNAVAQPREEDVTRSGNVVANLALRDVKRIYIDVRGEGAFSELRSNLAETLGSSGVVASTTDQNEADGALKIMVSPGGSQLEVTAQLVNARGSVIWPSTGRARRYLGEPTKVVSEIIRDLLSDIRKARD